MNCPNCGSENILPITYGTPPLSGARLRKAIDAGELILGGCVLCGDRSAYACRVCGHRFGELPKKTWKPWKKKGNN